jgi:hypothetical protein
MLVYLPAGYDESSSQRYPAIYFLPNPFDDSYRFDFDHRDAQSLFDRAIATGMIGKFILVAVDMNTPLGTSWYVNSSGTGSWEDFMIQELVTYIRCEFQDLAPKGLTRHCGNFHRRIWGYPFLVCGIRMSLVFCVCNAPMFQAHLPDPDKPPPFMDLPAHQEQGQLIIDAKLMERFRNNFYLETMIPQYADNPKPLRGFKFDWPGTDPNLDHVYANQAFTHKLNEFGVIDGAEEYNGAFGESDWGIDGRVYRMICHSFRNIWSLMRRTTTVTDSLASNYTRFGGPHGRRPIRFAGLALEMLTPSSAPIAARKKGQRKVASV